MCSVTLAKVLNFSVPQFLPLYIGKQEYLCHNKVVVNIKLINA